ncbi:hypothetical protein J2TS4_57010 [Paenibacillus sp. J2TS4]|nr:hypothetical protein J2TS4_57010 [Paenibacillus sp. J2TS4]
MRNFIMWLENQKYSFKSILCICSDEKTWADRLNIRKIDPLPNQMITDFDELKKYYTDLSTKPFDGELVVDTVEAVDSIIDKAIAFLQ